MTQERLGFTAKLHRNYVGSAERGERNISIEALDRWLGASGLSWEEFGRRLDAAVRESRRIGGRPARDAQPGRAR